MLFGMSQVVHIYIKILYVNEEIKENVTKFNYFLQPLIYISNHRRQEKMVNSL